MRSWLILVSESLKLLKIPLYHLHQAPSHGSKCVKIYKGKTTLEHSHWSTVGPAEFRTIVWTASSANPNFCGLAFVPPEAGSLPLHKLADKAHQDRLATTISSLTFNWTSLQVEHSMLQFLYWNKWLTIFGECVRLARWMGNPIWGTATIGVESETYWMIITIYISAKLGQWG